LVAETSIEETSEILPYSEKYPAKSLTSFLEKFLIYHIEICKPDSKDLTKYQPKKYLKYKKLLAFYLMPNGKKIKRIYNR
jgi:hypothetical protein